MSGNSLRNPPSGDTIGVEDDAVDDDHDYDDNGAYHYAKVV